MTEATTRRGTTNGNARGSSYARRARRKWLTDNFPSDQEGLCRCYRCGRLLYNPDALPLQFLADLASDERLAVPIPPTEDMPYWTSAWALPITVDRIIPGCQGGTYRRNNIRPACGPCNSETGGALGASRRTR